MLYQRMSCKSALKVRLMPDTAVSHSQMTKHFVVKTKCVLIPSVPSGINVFLGYLSLHAKQSALHPTCGAAMFMGLKFILCALKIP